MNIRNTLSVLLACTTLMWSGPTAEAAKTVPPDHSVPPRVVNLAICLDTSGSMQGLIEAAKQKLWAIVNDLALAEPTPTLQVALLTYGNNGHAEENGWVFVEAPLTEDLDLVSERLFALSTNGGTELVGRVLHRALTALDWHPSPDALKLMVVAGNESADQDQVMSFRDICKQAISQGIMVNSIYCGNPADQIAPGWKEVSSLADGHFASIDHNNGTIVVTTPHDDRLAELSSMLNTTYIPFGAAGEAKFQNQTTQDCNAMALNSAAAASRANTKAGRLYSCGSWDLVDASKKKDFDLAKVKKEELPAIMQKMSQEERLDHLETLKKKRSRIQTEIQELDKHRQLYIQAEIKKSNKNEDQSFDQALRNSLRSQAIKKGFVYPTAPATVSEKSPEKPIKEPVTVEIKPDTPSHQTVTPTKKNK